MSGNPASLLASLRGLATNGVGLLRTRLELLKVETEEEAARVVGLLLWGFVAVLFGCAGAVFLAVFLTVLWWESHRLLALGVFAALFVATAAVAAGMARRLARQGSRLFAASLAELRRDEEALSGEPRP